jgi:hypothetical protein
LNEGMTITPEKTIIKSSIIVFHFRDLFIKKTPLRL